MVSGFFGAEAHFEDGSGDIDVEGFRSNGDIEHRENEEAQNQAGVNAECSMDPVKIGKEIEDCIAKAVICGGLNEGCSDGLDPYPEREGDEG